MVLWFGAAYHHRFTALILILVPLLHLWPHIASIIAPGVPPHRPRPDLDACTPPHHVVPVLHLHMASTISFSSTVQ